MIKKISLSFLFLPSVQAPGADGSIQMRLEYNGCIQIRLD